MMGTLGITEIISLLTITILYIIDQTNLVMTRIDAGRRVIFTSIVRMLVVVPYSVVTCFRSATEPAFGDGPQLVLKDIT